MACLEFEQGHYSTPAVSSLDTIFYASHLLMTSVHKRVLVTEREQLVFEVAICVLAGILLMKIFYRPLYNRWRKALVLICHLIFTTLRAAAVHTMAPKMAVHYRINLFNNKDSAAVFLASILACMGGPFRLFEMLGLQQPFSSHVIVSLYYLFIHSYASSSGCRLAYSNSLFFLVHEVNDGLNSLVETALEALLPLPISEQATCSSCPGVALYGTLLLYGSVAVPLYVTYRVEQAARVRYNQRMATAAQQQQQQQQAGTLPAAAQQQQQAAEPDRPVAEQQQQQPESDDAADAAGAGPELAVMAAPRQSTLLAWCVHGLVLLAMLLLCWVVSNAFAHVLLPKVLDSGSLAYWCPNRPFAPYMIAGQVWPPDV